MLLEIGTLYACSMLYPSPSHIDIVVAYKRWEKEGNRGRGKGDNDEAAMHNLGEDVKHKTKTPKSKQGNLLSAYHHRNLDNSSRHESIGFSWESLISLMCLSHFIGLRLMYGSKHLRIKRILEGNCCSCLKLKQAI